MIRRPTLHFDEQFTTMPNEWLRDPRTTFATKGFLAHLLSHRPGWRVTLRSLSETYPEGIAALQTIVRNAVDTGYLVVVQQRDQGGRFAETSYDLCDPFASAAPRADSPCTENPCTENPYTENPRTKKNISKKNISREEHLEDLSSPALPASRTLDEVQAPTELDPSTPARSTAPAKVAGSAQPATRPDVEGLLDHLDQRLAANGARLPSRTKTNRNAARLLLDVDGRPLDEAHQLINWATHDEFWRTNILSMSKFRAKYDQLRMKANLHRRPAAVPQSRPVPNVDPDDVEAYIAAMTGGNR